MKRIFLFLFAFLCSVALSAQSYTPPAFADVDDNYRNYVNNVFKATACVRTSHGTIYY